LFCHVKYSLFVVDAGSDIGEAGSPGIGEAASLGFSFWTEKAVRKISN
jgi:hypothetical protein